MSGPYAASLGARAAELHPRVREWLVPAGAGAGAVTVTGKGIFDEAGVRSAVVGRMLRLAGLDMPTRARTVPFTVAVTVRGAVASTRRTLVTPEGVHTIADTTKGVPGRMIDSHAGGRILVEMVPRVVGGALDVRSRRARLALGTRRGRAPRRARLLLPVPCPRILVHHSWEEAAAAHRIDVSVSIPLLGEVFGYRGLFHES